MESRSVTSEEAIRWARDQAEHLTPVERELVRAVAVYGLSYADAARALFKSLLTVNRQAKVIGQKVMGPGDPRTKIIRLGTILHLIGEL